MRKKYPEHELISDIGSGMNMNRKGLRRNKYSNGHIKILMNKEPKEELVEDVLQVMNIFVAKMNGMRKYQAE